MKAYRRGQVEDQNDVHVDVSSEKIPYNEGVSTPGGNGGSDSFDSTFSQQDRQDVDAATNGNGSKSSFSSIFKDNVPKKSIHNT